MADLHNPFLLDSGSGSTGVVWDRPQRKSVMPDLTIPTGAIADAVEALDANDERLGIDRAEGLTLRILKVGEEFGEVALARIGSTGQNPRKGVTHSAGDLRDELFDVAFTALVAAATFDPDWAFAFGLHVKAKTAHVVEAVSNA